MPSASWVGCLTQQLMDHEDCPKDGHGWPTWDTPTPPIIQRVHFRSPFSSNASSARKFPGEPRTSLAQMACGQPIFWPSFCLTNTAYISQWIQGIEPPIENQKENSEGFPWACLGSTGLLWGHTRFHRCTRIGTKDGTKVSVFGVSFLGCLLLLGSPG